MIVNLTPDQLVLYRAEQIEFNKYLKAMGYETKGYLVTSTKENQIFNPEDLAWFGDTKAQEVFIVSRDLHYDQKNQYAIDIVAGFTLRSKEYITRNLICTLRPTIISHQIDEYLPQAIITKAMMVCRNIGYYNTDRLTIITHDLILDSNLYPLVNCVWKTKPQQCYDEREALEMEVDTFPVAGVAAYQNQYNIHEITPGLIYHDYPENAVKDIAKFLELNTANYYKQLLNYIGDDKLYVFTDKLALIKIHAIIKVNINATRVYLKDFKYDGDIEQLVQYIEPLVNCKGPYTDLVICDKHNELYNSSFGQIMLGSMQRIYDIYSIPIYTKDFKDIGKVL